VKSGGESIAEPHHRKPYASAADVAFRKRRQMRKQDSENGTEMAHT